MKEGHLMQNKPVTAGNKGPDVRCDCFVTLELTATGGLELDIDSKVGSLYGVQIRTLAQTLLVHFGIEHARLRVEDSGAFDFVLAARIEAAVRQLLPQVPAYLPELIEENCYSSSAERMRFSRLYIPGNSPKMMINAGIYGAHGVILDLEDSVPPAKKDEARLLVRNALRQVDFYGAERMVRINQLPRGLEDLDQLVPHNLHLVLLPKCEGREQIDQVNARIGQLQEQHGQSGEIYLMPIIESSLGVIKAYEIASAPNVVAVAIGLEDYCADLGVKRTTASSESLYAKSALVNACSAAGVQAIDSVFSDFQDTEGLIATLRQGIALGFQGIGCIHPAQVPIVNDLYAPSAEEIAYARKVVLCFEEAEKKGLGVVALGSKMIDPPVVLRALQTIDRALAAGKLDKDWRTEHE
jgi:citrate lyase subunit beta/citryl-CoA lyase